MAYKLYECTTNNHSEMDKIWDGIWSNFVLDKEMKKIDKDEELRPILLKYLPKEGKILEGGCGTGRWVVFLKKKCFDIIGVDFALDTLKRIKHLDESIPVEFGDINKTNFPDNYFSAYISLGVVEHFEEGPFVSIKEAERILKPRGMLLISIPVLNSIRRLTMPIEIIHNFFRENRFIRKLIGKEEYPKKVFVEYRFTISEFEYILKKNHFSILHKFTLLHSPFTLFNYFLEPPNFIRSKIVYRFLNIISIYLEKISKWIAPHQVIWICENNK